MLFNTYIFIFIFLPTVLLIYFLINKLNYNKAAKLFLIVASLFFYSFWNIIYLPLILGSIIFNYIIGKKVSTSPNRKLILIFGIIANILLLGYFKYADFFIENVNYLFFTNIESLNLLLPLAISFFTFQQIAYLADSYKHETKEYDFFNYTLFIVFFPQLIAGPIVHHKEMMPQFFNKQNSILNYRNLSLGLFIFSMGLFKKVVIADTFSIYAINGYDIATTLNFIEAWITSLSYTFQIYFDFSGYTDMAIGIGLLFNIRLPINFNSPYKALNIQEFWRRWHITLSKFLRDYIYIPLGGSRKGDFRTYNNLMITFLIGGLWHGAGWTFIIWGFLHGFFLIIHRFWQKLGMKMNKILAWIITFNFINITWVFFRAETLDNATKVLKGMFGFSQIIIPDFLINYLGTLTNYGIIFGNPVVFMPRNFDIIIYIIFAFIIISLKNSSYFIKKFKANLFYSIFFIILFITSFIYLNRVSEFLYYQF